MPHEDDDFAEFEQLLAETEDTDPHSTPVTVQERLDQVVRRDPAAAALVLAEWVTTENNADAVHGSGSLRQAAVVVRNLPGPLAAELLHQMPQPQADSLTAAVADLDDVTEQQCEDAVFDFFKLSGVTNLGGYGLPLAEHGQSHSDPWTGHASVESTVPFGFLHHLGADELLALIDHDPTIPGAEIYRIGERVDPTGWRKSPTPW